jgi:FkbM family methyltransferase
MTLAHAARTWVRSRLGLDVQRYPQSDPLYGLSLLLAHLEVDLVLDVGANDGGYTRTLRRLGYRGEVVSFEPLPGPFALLRAAAADDTHWDVVRCAVGDDEGEIVVHVAGNDGASSSVLPMLDAHLTAAPAAAYVADEKVPLHRLDGLVGDRVEGRRCFLKMDVQGFERAVLDGAVTLLSGGHVLGVQAEMSLVPLYEGSMLWRETVDRLSGAGYELASLVPGFTDPTSGRLLQADGVFVRSS